MSDRSSKASAKQSKDAPRDFPLCPYCSEWPRFQGVLTGEPERLEENVVFYVGKFWNSNARNRASSSYEVFSDHYRIQASGKQFIKRFSGFHLTLIGFRYTFEESKLLEVWRYTNINSSPFFAYLESQIVNPEKPYVFFPICRITHKRSGAIVDGHAWPTHGLIITAQNFNGGTLSSDEVKITSEALEFFRIETRGGGQKIEEVAVIEAVRQLGTKATQMGVSRKLNVSLITLQRWVSRKGKGWEELKNEYLTTGFTNEHIVYAPPLSLMGLQEMAANPSRSASEREAAQKAIDGVNKILNDR
jgi:hypothetical protein